MKIYPNIQSKSRNINFGLASKVASKANGIYCLLEGEAAKRWGAEICGIRNLKVDNLDEGCRTTFVNGHSRESAKYDILAKPNGTLILKKISEAGTKIETILESISGVVWHKVEKPSGTVLAIRKADDNLQLFRENFDYFSGKSFVRVA